MTPDSRAATLHTRSHGVEKLISTSDVSIDARPESHAGLVIAVVIRPTGGNQIQLPGDLRKLPAIRGSVLAVKDFDRAKAAIHQASYERKRDPAPRCGSLTGCASDARPPASTILRTPSSNVGSSRSTPACASSARYRSKASCMQDT